MSSIRIKMHSLRSCVSRTTEVSIVLEKIVTTVVIIYVLFA